MAICGLPMKLETSASVHNIAGPVRQASLLPRHIAPLALPFEQPAKLQASRPSSMHRAASSTAAEDIRSPQYDAYVWGSPDAAPTQQLAPCVLYSYHMFLGILMSCLSVLTARGNLPFVRRESAISSGSSFNA